MSHGHAETKEHKPHVLPYRTYFAVWMGLLVFTAVTVWVSYFDFGTFNLIVAMGVATLKATLVALFFMHLKYDEKFNAIVFVSSLAFLAVFFILTLADTMERGNVDALEAGEIELVPARPELLELGGEGDAHHGESGEPGAADGHEAAPGGDGTVADPAAEDAEWSWGTDKQDSGAEDQKTEEPGGGGGH